MKCNNGKNYFPEQEKDGSQTRFSSFWLKNKSTQSSRKLTFSKTLALLVDKKTSKMAFGIKSQEI